MIRVSSGTAGVLGLHPNYVEIPPTTAYFLIGEHCSRTCSFCPQGKDSVSFRKALLSRVTWPAFPMKDVLKNTFEVFSEGRVKRICMQVVQRPETWECLLDTVQKIRCTCDAPISISWTPDSPERAEALFEAGIDRLSIAVDTVSGNLFETIKGRAWEPTWRLLRSLAQKYPGKIGTHLIIGLGESEKDAADRIQQCVDAGVNIGLFAFTPVRGTPMEHLAQPPMDTYRRIQAAYHIIRLGASMSAAFSFDTDGKIKDFGIDASHLAQLLSDGRAFRTTGCPGCNRPNYNERPGQVPYNYPRSLDDGEITASLSSVLSAVTREGCCDGYSS